MCFFYLLYVVKSGRIYLVFRPVDNILITFSMTMWEGVIESILRFGPNSWFSDLKLANIFSTRHNELRKYMHMYTSELLALSKGKLDYMLCICVAQYSFFLFTQTVTTMILVTHRTNMVSWISSNTKRISYFQCKTSYKFIRIYTHIHTHTPLRKYTHPTKTQNLSHLPDTHSHKCITFKNKLNMYTLVY